MSPNVLSPAELRAFARLGDLMAPGGSGLPSFTGSGCIEHIDGVLQPLGATEHKQLKMLLRVLSHLPDAGLRAVLHMTHRSATAAYPGSGLARTVDLALRGVVWSLYYSGRVGSAYRGPGPLEVIGYAVRDRPECSA